MVKNKTLYQVFGVKKNATTEQVQLAYKKRAMESHPDRHFGDEEKSAAQVEFDAVKLAYEVLKDPERRKLYDETGQTEKKKVPDELKLAIMLLVEALNGAVTAVLSRGVRPATVDLVQLMRGEIESAIDGFKAARQQLIDQMLQLTEIENRFVADEGQENYLQDVIKAQISGTKIQIEALDEQVQKRQTALLLLCKFKFLTEVQRSGNSWGMATVPDWARLFDKSFGKG